MIPCSRPSLRCALAAGLFLAAWAGGALADPCTAPSPRAGDRFAGVVRYVGDGDSLCVGKSADPQTWIEVRLADFYAPELNDEGGQAAKDRLTGVVMGRQLECVAGRRSYDRVVARCRLGGVPLAKRLRALGAVEGGRGFAP